MSKTKIKTYVASPSFFDKEGNIDHHANRRLMHHYITNGIQGIFLLSSTGEYHAMTHQKRLEFLDLMLEEKQSNISILSMVSDACIDNVLGNIQDMNKRPVDGIVLHPPYYYKYSDAELELFFLRAAEASEHPLYLYNQPTRLPNSLHETLIVDLSKHENIIGLKDTGIQKQRIQQLSEIFKERNDFNYFVGSEKDAVFAAQHGSGFVFALVAIAPKLFLDIQKLESSSSDNIGKNLQDKVDLLCTLFNVLEGGSALSFNNFVLGIKLALSVLGIGTPYPSQLFIEPNKMKELNNTIECILHDVIG